MKRNKIIKRFIFMCVLLACFSCNSDEIINLSDDTNEIQNFITNTKPDKIIENSFGTLYYNKELKIWIILPHSSEILNDPSEYYLIVDMENNNFSFEEMVEVSISGFCYQVPKSILLDWAINKGFAFTAGADVFFIKVIYLNY